MKLSSIVFAAVLALPSLVSAATEWKFTSKAPVTPAVEQALKAVTGVEKVTTTGNTVTVTGSEKVNTEALKTAATKAGLTADATTAPAATTTTTTTTTTAPAAPTAPATKK